MFVPPRCPNTACREHFKPREDFFKREGFYHPKCRMWPVPRFRCRHCKIGFSRQTFRADYCDKRPDTNIKLFALLTSGIGFRQSARLLNMTRECVHQKFQKMARHLWKAHTNLMKDFPRNAHFQMDEMETFECRRNTRPVTVPVVIHERSMFVVGADCASIRPSGKMTPARKRAIEREEKQFGRRKNRSRSCLLRVLRGTARHTSSDSRVHFTSDEKTLYPPLLRQVFGPRLASHVTVSSQRRRDAHNPLFRINLTNAIVRDLIGRMRRRSWLVSKQRRYLRMHLWLFIAYRNYHRPRFNRDSKTPAELLGFASRALTRGELLSWRQDWGRNSMPLPGCAA